MGTGIGVGHIPDGQAREFCLPRKPLAEGLYFGPHAAARTH